jgi:nanoRNase/pAp phosphatase (c-di-AMP/oligoRNAs hydrolase)
MTVTVVAPAPPAELVDLLARPRGSALMLGHVHPDGDVLGTLLGLGLAMEKAGWAVTYGGPAPAPIAGRCGAPPLGRSRPSS